MGNTGEVKPDEMLRIQGTVVFANLAQEDSPDFGGGYKVTLGNLSDSAIKALKARGVELKTIPGPKDPETQESETFENTVRLRSQFQPDIRTGPDGSDSFTDLECEVGSGSVVTVLFKVQQVTKPKKRTVCYMSRVWIEKLVERGLRGDGGSSGGEDIPVL